MHFPVESPNGKWRWYKAYRFTAPGWEECTIVGLAAAKRVIQGRTDPAVLNTFGINPYSKESRTCRQKPEDNDRASVMDAIRESRAEPVQPHVKRDKSDKSSEHDI
jgi:hypothetical protein